jgi:hypothetical protein
MQKLFCICIHVALKSSLTCPLTCNITCSHQWFVNLSKLPSGTGNPAPITHLGWRLAHLVSHST